MATKNKEALSHDEASKALWEAQEAIHKVLKVLTGNPACKDTVTHLWSNVDTISNTLKWIRNLKIGNYYKMTEYDKSYYIVRLEYFIPSDSTIECYCRVLTSSKEKIDYNTPNADYIILPTGTLERKDFDLIIEELPLFTGNIFNGSLLQELLKQ